MRLQITVSKVSPGMLELLRLRTALHTMKCGTSITYLKGLNIARIANRNHNATLPIIKESTMPALTIKNIPDSLYEQLKTAAELHRRSINSEVIVCLEKILTPTKITPADRLSRIEQLRSSIKTNNITPEDIEQAINSGRP